jgi:hypothetical protein
MSEGIPGDFAEACTGTFIESRDKTDMYKIKAGNFFICSPMKYAVIFGLRCNPILTFF